VATQDREFVSFTFIDDGLAEILCIIGALFVGSVGWSSLQLKNNAIVLIKIKNINFFITYP